MAWVGYAENDKLKTVRPVASAGFERGFLQAVRTAWDDGIYGQGPTGKAIRKHQPCIKRNIINDPDFLPWCTEAVKRDYISVASLPLIYRDRILGALTVYTSEQDAFDDDEMKLLTELAGDLAYGIFSLRMQAEREKIAADLEKNYKKLRKILEQTVNSLSSTLAKRDLYTSGHQTRVTKLACAIAREMELTDEQIEGLRVAGMLHDIGKIYVPAEILSKPTSLTAAEFDIMKAHAQAGYDIIQSIEFPWPVAQIILQHHERLNGSGYPQGLKNGDILIEARIIAVADVIEAMSSHRPYRPARGVDVALDEIVTNRGVLYDTAAAAACLRLFREKGFKFE
jgi:putative nucleotidyltransferase with HDIG domain